MGKELILTDVLALVKNDIETERHKNQVIKGYWIIKDLFKLVPRKFEELIEVDEKDNSLWFSYQRLGKITNIEDIEEEESDKPSFNKTIAVIRTKGEPVRIFFIWGKNVETGEYEITDYKIVVGY